MMNRYQAILADLDGTVHRGNVLIAGVAEAYEELCKRGMRWIFLSNNAGGLAADLARKLSDLGIPAREKEVVNSAAVLMRTLTRDYADAAVMVVGQPRLVAGLRAAGIAVVEDPLAAKILVIAIDATFTYEKLCRAQTAVHNGALFWATNTDATFPVVGGFKPGAGAIVAAVSAAVGRPPDRVFGKPSPDMAYLALERLGLAADACLVVGDRVETDILFARNAGMDSVLVLTGATSREDLPNVEVKPTYVLESIVDLPALLAG